MKACADCVPCLMKRVLFQARLIGDPNEFRTVQSALREYAAGFKEGVCSADIATRVHRVAYDSMGCEDPYRQLKLDADRIASDYVADAEAFIDSSDDRFAAAVRVSIIGNIMDFGSGVAIDDPEEFRRMFGSLLAEGIGSDDTAALKRLVESSDTVLYAFDNCGEVMFDKLLIREIKAMGKRVVCVVRGKPILNDVAYEDAVRAGVGEVADRIVTTGAFAVGFPPVVCDEGLAEELPRAGVLITKGMANYESLSDMNLNVPVAYLLRAKCAPVSRSLGVPMGTNVVRVSLPQR